MPRSCRCSSMKAASMSLGHGHKQQVPGRAARRCTSSGRHHESQEPREPPRQSGRPPSSLAGSRSQGTAPGADLSRAAKPAPGHRARAGVRKPPWRTVPGTGSPPGALFPGAKKPTPMTELAQASLPVWLDPLGYCGCGCDRRLLSSCMSTATLASAFGVLATVVRTEKQFS